MVETILDQDYAQNLQASRLIVCKSLVNLGSALNWTLDDAQVQGDASGFRSGALAFVDFDLNTSGVWVAPEIKFSEGRVL